MNRTLRKLVGAALVTLAPLAVFGIIAANAGLAFALSLFGAFAAVFGIVFCFMLGLHLLR
jgi:hypothetical protein